MSSIKMVNQNIQKMYALICGLHVLLRYVSCFLGLVMSMFSMSMLSHINCKLEHVVNVGIVWICYITINTCITCSWITC